MWRLLPKIHHETIGLCITPTTLIASWIQPHQGSAPYTLKAYKEIKLSPTIFCKDRIFNPTVIRNHIRSFITTCALEHAYVLCAIQGPGIQEKIIAHTTTSETDDTIKHQLHFKQYLYTVDESGKNFYHVSIMQPLLTQYLLLALQENLNLIAIVPYSIPHLALYQRIHVPVFRRAQLAQDMQQHNNQLAALFTTEQIKRLITVPAHAHSATLQGLSLALGLFLLGSEHETYKFY